MNYENFLDETKELFAKGEEFINNEKYDDAIDCFEKALDVQVAKYGREHESAVACLTQLGMSYLVCGKYDEAIKNVKEAIDTGLKLFHYESQELGNLYYLLGTAYMQTEDFAAAAKALENVVKISSKLFGPNSKETDTVRTIYNQAMARNTAIDKDIDAELAKITDEVACFKAGTNYFESGTAYLAVRYFEKAVALREQHVTEDDEVMVDYLRSLAVAYTEVHMEDKSIATLERLITASERIFGEVHQNVSGAYNLMSYNYLVQGNHAKAIEYMNTSIKINIKLYGEGSPEIIHDYSILSKIYAVSGDIDKAIASAIIELGIIDSLENEANIPVQIACYENLASLYVAKADYDNAIDYLLKELEATAKQYGSESREVLAVYDHLGYCYHASGNEDKVKETADHMTAIMQKLDAAHAHQHHDGCTCGCHDHHGEA